MAAAVFCFVFAPRAEAVDYTSSQSGNWHDEATWGGVGGYPDDGTDSAVISVSHTVTIAQAGTAYTVNNLTVNGVLTHTANSTVAATPYYRVDLTIGGDLTVDVNGSIDAKAKGFSTGNGPAPSGGGGTYAASHGGLGGINTASPYTTYGSVTNPTTLGSSGGHPAAGYGGGAIILTVAGNATVNGIIRADAADKTSDWLEGSAGGSVNLTAGTLAGSGVISANSHTNGNYNYRGGGGGRVAVKLTSGPDTGGVVLRAYGGRSSEGAASGGASGTIYLQTTAPAYSAGALIVDNGGVAHDTDSSALISSNVTGRSIATLIITNSGVFAIGTNVSFIVTSNFLNYAQTASLSPGGGTFEVGGSGTMTFGGSIISNRFHHFTCTNAGKRIVFPSGSSNRLDGLLTLRGTSGDEVELVSTDAGQWKLTAPSPFVGSVSYVDVTNSDASAGATIAALDSINRGGNVNWSFASAGQTNTWTGASSTNWGTAGNWDLGRLPVGTDVVRIWTNNSPPNWPVLSDNVLATELWIENGASLFLGGKNLTVSSNMVLTGTLVASGSETVTLQGGADWSGGTFTKAASSVVMGGTGPQAVNFNGKAFSVLSAQNSSSVTITGSLSAVSFLNTGGAVNFSNNLTVGTFNSTGGNLAFGGDVTATNFSVVATGVTLTFLGGGTYAVTNLTLYGSATNRLTLVSSSSPSKWNLNVSGVSCVSGVTVSDSDASGGLTIRPSASSEGTPSSTVNWVFGSGTWKIWVGGSVSFTNASNWDPSGTLDAMSRLIIERTNGMSAPLLTNSLTVADLAIGGLGAATLTLQAPLTVTNRVSILNQGVITHTENGAVGSPVISVDMTVGGDLVVAVGGSIDATAQGYASGPAPGENYKWGGNHGGLGYNSSTNPYTTYGSVTNPVLPGSRGGFGGAVNEPGGGVVILRVTGDVTVDGAIKADARSASSTRDSGSGGSVNLRANRLTGSGLISANSNTNSMHGGGGGGRVAVRLVSGNDTGSVLLKALGGIGSSSDFYGAPGTIYLQVAGQKEGAGTVFVNSGGQSIDADSTTLISTNVTDNLQDVAVVVTNANSVFQIAVTNVYIRDIYVYTNASVVLGTNTLYVWSSEHGLEASGSPVDSTTNRVDNYDQIQWLGSRLYRGTLLIIR